MIRLENVTLTAGNFTLADISFSVPTGEHAVLMGRSGAGKTTILEALCGLRTPVRGKIWLGSGDVTHATPAARGIGYVPQEGALFLHLSVAENLAFALRCRRTAPEAIAKRVQELSHGLRLENLMQRRPGGLSGGERQRVALGRALAAHPSVLLLDEPFSALDSESRHELRELLMRLRIAHGLTMLHVTHDAADCESLGTQVFELADGQVRPKPG